MKLKQRPLLLSSLVLTGGLALAHHVPVALSYIEGGDILTEITVFLGLNDFGVPPVVLSLGEVEHTFHLADGDSFTVVDQVGTTQTVTFDGADFADIGNADGHEVAEVINEQLSIANARVDNGYFVFDGVTGGPASSLTLVDGVGTPLQDLSMVSSGGDRRTRLGFHDVTLTLSLPPGVSFENQPYLVFASTTTGQWVRDGQTIPVTPSVAMRRFFNATFDGTLPSFQGTLDGNGDAVANLPVQTIKDLLGNTPPDVLYLSYVVLTPDGAHIDYVSNLFTIHLID